MPRRPNLLLIVTDNQSPWTLGCYGNPEIQTPATDQLATEGVRLTHACCVNPVCSPNRATLLTGLLPSQHGVHSWLGAEKPSLEMGPAATCTIREFTNLPSLLAEAGYDCGMCGKWHLGDSLHPQLGFRYWYSLPHGHTRTFYDHEVVWQGKVCTEPRYSLDAISDHAVDFLRQPRDNPFFLYVGYNGPYGLDQDMLVGHRNHHYDTYARQPMTSFPDDPPHPWQRSYLDRLGNPTARRSYAAAVSGVDDQLARLLATLDELDLSEDTLVVFTADHGLSAGHHGFWGMSDHTMPRALVQENVEVPCIYRHPGQLPAETTLETLVSHYDVMPTLLDYLDLTPELESPGRSYAAQLTGAAEAWDDEIVFHEYENLRAAITPEWKLTMRHPAGPHELYNLARDPGEQHNLHGTGLAIEADLTTRLNAFFTRYATADYDVWRGGHSKAG